MINPIIKAVNYASMIHYHDKRKYGGGPYIDHCLRVMVSTMRIAATQIDYCVCAAVCHDVLEDHPEPTPERAYEQLELVIGTPGTVLVGELTNRFTSEQYPDKNRAWRKEAEVDRLAAASQEARIIKMLDRIDNLRCFDFKELIDLAPEVRKQALGFGKTYAKESIALFQGIGGIHPELQAAGLVLAEGLL